MSGPGSQGRIGSASLPRVKTQRRSWIAAGCGCLTVMPAALFVLGALLAAADGTGDLGAMAVSACCGALVGLAGVALLVFGLLPRPVDPGQVVQGAIAQAAATGGPVTFSVPGGVHPNAVVGAFHAATGGSPGNYNRDLAAANQFLFGRRYDEAIAAFRALADAYPDHRGDATSSIGACLHMMGRYEEAIATYEQARALGGDPRTIDENIQESRQALARRG